MTELGKMVLGNTNTISMVMENSTFFGFFRYHYHHNGIRNFHYQYNGIGITITTVLESHHHYGCIGISLPLRL